MTTVTVAYLDGIRDGRAMLRRLGTDGYTRAEAIEHELTAAESELQRNRASNAALSEYARDYYHGLAEFWRNQAKRQ